MLRNSFIAFICTWLVWFWIDKPGAGLDQFLQVNDSMLINFQRAFDLAKAGFIAPSFVYIWYAHYIVLSLILGVTFTYIHGFITDYFSRKRREKSFTSMLQKNQDNKKYSSDGFLDGDK